MKYISLVALILLLPAAAQAQVETLGVMTHTWDGAKTYYPEGEVEITSIRITMAPGSKLPFHCHPVPIIGYVTKGNLRVEKLSGEYHDFTAGDTINEVQDTWHRGVNLSDSEIVELVGFYLGQAGTPVSIKYSPETESRCQ